MNRITARVRQSQTDGGFTLIELLIVIVILGILAGIAIFSLEAFQQDANDACETANKRIQDTEDAAREARTAIGGSGSGSYSTGDC